MSSRVRGRDDPGGEADHARRVYKRAKNGLLTADEMTPEEFGLLYLYYPTSLPDVQPAEVADE